MDSDPCDDNDDNRCADNDDNRCADNDDNDDNRCADNDNHRFHNFIRERNLGGGVSGTAGDLDDEQRFVLLLEATVRFWRFVH